MKAMLARWAMVFAILGVAFPAVSSAAPLPFDGGAYSYYADNTPIEKVLREFAANFGLVLDLPGKVKPILSGRLAANTASEFLSSVTSAAGLDWFYNAGTLYISSAAERRIERHNFSKESISGAKNALTGLQILDARFGWAALPDQGAIVVSGPPAYVDLVGKTLKSLQSTAPDQDIAVVRLKHASVEDRSVTIRDRSITIPGMRAMLQSLNSTTAPSAAPRELKTARETTKSDTQAAALGKTEPTSTPTTAITQVDSADSRPPDAVSRDVRIEADLRLNALILRGPSGLIDTYKKLIAELDLPGGLVEVEAMTIDVNRSRVDELGIDWSAKIGNVSIGSGDSTQALARNVLGLGYRATPGSAITSQASALLARVRMMEQAGEAYVVGKPSILTSDNLGAVLDLSQTFYTKVSGERVANLTPVTVGVMLKVTPRIIVDGDQAEIQLTVDIEDGTLIDRSGLDLPVVQRTTISTQATIREGHSLLIGGYDTETRQEALEKVPGLADLPGIGAFFRSARLGKERRKRMFLITPRIVALQANQRVITNIPHDALTLQPLLKLEMLMKSSQ